MTYLAYDIRSIQKFLFAVPNLRCVVGASELIARVDERVRGRFAGNAKYCGGGGGLLEVDNQAALEEMIAFIRAEAAEIGVDLRIGYGETPSAAKSQSVLYAYWLENLEGEPCAMSGLYPVVSGDPSVAWKSSPAGRDVHRLVGMRRDASRIDRLGEHLLEKIKPLLPQELQQFELQFFCNVSPESSQVYADNNPADSHEAYAGAYALGARNRWAVIAMDGNDAGNQHLVAQERVNRGDWTEAQRQSWIAAMSGSLSQATTNAFETALAGALETWWQAVCGGHIPRRCIYTEPRQGRECLVLPFRPLIVGGDDVVLLCHTELAMDFVIRMSTQFTSLAEQSAKEFKVSCGLDLWPATGNSLTISGGVLYCKTSYPLHSAMQYAESLLASAKGAFRRDRTDSQQAATPTPAAVDFDCVTDTLLDTPAERRHRELVFFDKDVNEEVVLTRRPYRLVRDIHSAVNDSFEELLELVDCLVELNTPRSILAEVAERLCRPWSERIEFLQSISRKHPELYELLAEPELFTGGNHPVSSSWVTCQKSGKTERRTSFLDALILLDEQRRQDSPTVF